MALQARTLRWPPLPRPGQRPLLAAPATEFLRLSPAVCGAGKEGRRKAAKQDFFFPWKVFFFCFYFLFSWQTKQAKVCLRRTERGQKFSRNKWHGPKQSSAPTSGQTSGGNRKIGRFCGFIIFCFFRRAVQVGRSPRLIQTTRLTCEVRSLDRAGGSAAPYLVLESAKRDFS